MLENLLTLYLPIMLTFVAVFLLVLGIGNHQANQLVRRRIRQVVEPRRYSGGSVLDRELTRLDSLLESLSKLSLPKEGWQNSGTRLRFVRAGFRSNTVARTYYAIKSILTLVVPLVLLVSLWLFKPGMQPSHLALTVLGTAALGYYLPDWILKTLTERRSTEMRDNLPDLIDLLVICTESGLGLDAALNRVSREIARNSQILAEEFYLAALEIRAGSGRVAALKNLALRVDLEDLYNLVSMLVQADKFGTSLAESLRIQSEVMRGKRMLRAEELAAKIPVKMLMPLIFFVFPSLMFVLIGPAVLRMSDVFGK